MFAYCINNPVNCVDSGGCFPCTYQDGGSMLELMNGIVDAGGGGGGGQVGPSGWNPGVNIPKLNLNAVDEAIDYITNTDEKVVLEAKHFAFYKGALVIKANLKGMLNGTAASFGIIVIDTDYTYNQTGIDTVNHEYGHFQHFCQIGAWDYFFTTAVPSMIGAGLDCVGFLPEGLYFNLPWERVADYFGGVTRNEHENWSQGLAAAFWIYTIGIS